MNQDSIRQRFDSFLRSRALKLTRQRERIFERAFETHEHFTADRLYQWMRGEEGSNVSRATVYRTLSLLEEGGFIGSMDSGRGELIYEHLLGHDHHDHLICLGCGRIDEFQSMEIEKLQEEVAREKGFQLVRHSLRLEGHCKDCQ